MELTEIKQILNKHNEKLLNIRGLFDLENKETNIQEYEEMMVDPSFGMIRIKHKKLLIKIMHSSQL